jgi:hypothetical protein
MRALAFTLVVSAMPSFAWADHTCPADSDTCPYLVNTGESGRVGVDGGGKSATKTEWIVAPSEKYLANGEVHVASLNGKHPRCEISSTGGGQTRRIGGVDVRFFKKYQVYAHAETGSGPQAIGRTAHMQCQFNGQLVNLPQMKNDRISSRKVINHRSSSPR